MAVIYGIFALAGFVLVVRLLLGTKSGGNRQEVSRWARQVKFSDGQLTAMRSLWHWYSTGSEPRTEPLAHLNPSELADLVHKCGVDFLPKRFRRRNEEALRHAFLEELQEKGVHEMDAEIIVGMKFGHLGPANDHV